MIKHNFGSQNRFKPCVAIVAMMIIFCYFPAFSWSRAIEFAESHQLGKTQKYDRKALIVDGDLLYPLNKIKVYELFSESRSHLLMTKNFGRNYNRLSPEEKNKLQQRLKEWKSLPPERQRMLRHRMEEYNRLPPQERQRFQQRYRRLQQLAPDERNKIQEKLRRWDKLSPGEKEQIRNRFREP